MGSRRQGGDMPTYGPHIAATRPSPRGPGLPQRTPQGPPESIRAGTQL